MDIKSTPEFLAEYLTFLLDFTAKPVKAVDSIRGDTRETISSKFLAFAALGAGAAMGIVQVGAAIGMAESQARLISITGKLPQVSLVGAAVGLAWLAGAVGHALLKALSLLEVFLLDEQRFRGSVTATVNATLAFCAWSIPLLTLVIVALRVMAARGLPTDPHEAGGLLYLLGLASCVYLAASFAGAHRIPFARAGGLFALTFMVFEVVIENIFLELF